MIAVPSLAANVVNVASSERCTMNRNMGDEVARQSTDALERQRFSKESGKKTDGKKDC